MARSRLLESSVLTSRKINKLSEGAETLFYRILVSVDDFGRYYANPKIIKSYCYPLRKISARAVQNRLEELHKVGLIQFYLNDGEEYLEINDFEVHQKFRTDIKRKEDYPTPQGYCNGFDRIRSDSERDVTDDNINNNKNNNKNNNENKNRNTDTERVVTYLNEKTGKNFSPESQETRKLISGRLNDGYTVDQFIQVIDTKVSKWGDDPKMADYLRPSTLFRKSNFENYLNERSSPKEFTTDIDDWARRRSEAND